MSLLARTFVYCVCLIAGIFPISADADSQPQPAPAPAPTQPGATQTQSGQNPIFPVIQCAFDINFMNQGDKSITKECRHLQGKTNYVVIFTGGSVHADAAVTAGQGTFSLSTASNTAKVTFAITANGGGGGGGGSSPPTYVWAAPGNLVLHGVVADAGGPATATLRFEGNGCQATGGGSPAVVNCSLQGTLIIRVEDN